MLAIRGDQFEALERAALSGTAEVLAPLLRQSWPDETAALPDAELRARIHRALTRGYELGFRDARSLAHVANLDIVLGEAFEQGEAFADLRVAIADTRVEARERIELLYARARAVRG